MDLDYDPITLLTPPTPARLKAFERSLSEDWERRFRLPPSYTEHVLRFHGGAPRKRRFPTPAGLRVVGRFFHFLTEQDTPPGEPSWRVEWGSSHNVLLDYAVERYLTEEYWGLRLQEHDETMELLPIAGLAPRDAPRVEDPGYSLDVEDEFDLLCLDFSRCGEPRVVLWQFTNMWSEPPVILLVAKSFPAFLELLVA